MTTIKIVKNGFFDTDTEGGGTRFIKFENITKINKPVEDINCGRWEIEVKHNHLQTDYNHTITIIGREKEVVTLHKKLLDAWMFYHTNSTSLEEQIEKLLSCIDVIPGGKEYEETKKQFEKRVGEENEEKDEKFELNF